MRKYSLSFFIILIIYYIATFLISITLLTKSVVNNNPTALEKYINVKDLRNNFYSDIYAFSSSLISLMDKKININNDSIKLTGELTPTFLEKLFFKIANNISADFSNPETMLYFYFNSNELNIYLKKSFTYFGDYSFQKYLIENQSENEKNINVNEVEKEVEKNKEKAKIENIISKFFKRIKSTDYFFLISPIHFKIDVKHQNIPFILILKFNGYIWKVQKITIPYKKLIDLKNISLSN